MEKDRLRVKVYLAGELIMQADLSPEMTVNQVEEWAQKMIERGCAVCFKRLPWPFNGPEERSEKRVAKEISKCT